MDYKQDEREILNLDISKNYLMMVILEGCFQAPTTGGGPNYGSW